MTVPHPLYQPPKRRGPTSKYDVPILRWVGYHHFVTTQQVVHRFWIQSEKGGSYGYRRVQALVERGELTEKRLNEEEGSASPRVLSLAPCGYLRLGHEPRPPRRGTDLRSLMLYRIQAAEMMLEREPEGWSVIPRRREDKVVKAVRAYALKRFQGVALDYIRVNEKTRVERLKPGNFSLPLNVLWREEDHALRFLLPVRRGRSYKRMLRKVTGVGFLKEVSFEVVSADPDLLEDAKEAIRQWAKRERVNVEIHSVPHFRTRPNPVEYHEMRQDAEAQQ